MLTPSGSAPGPGPLVPSTWGNPCTRGTVAWGNPSTWGTVAWGNPLPGAPSPGATPAAVPPPAGSRPGPQGVFGGSGDGPAKLPVLQQGHGLSRRAHLPNSARGPHQEKEDLKSRSQRQRGSTGWREHMKRGTGVRVAEEETAIKCTSVHKGVPARDPDNGKPCTCTRKWGKEVFRL